MVEQQSGKKTHSKGGTPLHQYNRKQWHGKMLKFIGSLELFFQRGAVALKFGKHFLFKSEIANF